MPWCPKCRRFQEEDDLCIYCWVETVEELESLRQEEPKSSMESDPEPFTFLICASEINEANIIQSLLKTYDIPSIRKHRGIGEYLQVVMGSSSLGIDIFVPQSQLEKASELVLGRINYLENEVRDIQENDISKEENTLPEEFYEANNENNENPHGIIMRLLISIIIGSAIASLFYIYYLF